MILLLVLFAPVACQRAQTSPAAESNLVPQTEAESETETETEQPTTEVSIAFPRNDAACSPATARAIERWATAWRRWRGYGPAVDPARLVELDAPRVDEGFRAQLSVRPNSLELNGNPVTLDTLTEAIVEIDRRRRREQKLLGNEQNPEPMSYGIGVAPDVAFERVQQVLERLDLEQDDEVAFVFAAPSIPDELEPYPDDVRARVERVLPSGDTASELLDVSKLREAFREATEDCPEIRDFAGELERAYPDERRRMLTEQLGDRWVECDCNADIEFVVGHYHRAQPGRAATAVDIVPDPDGTVLARAPETTWSEIAPRLLELRGQPVCIESDSEKRGPLFCTSGAD